MLMAPGEVTFQEIAKNIRSLADKQLGTALPCFSHLQFREATDRYYQCDGSFREIQKFRIKSENSNCHEISDHFSADPRPTHRLGNQSAECKSQSTI